MINRLYIFLLAIFLISSISATTYSDCSIYGNCKSTTTTTSGTAFANTTGTVNSSVYWGPYLYSLYDMANIKSFSYNQTYSGSTYNASYVPYTGATSSVNLNNKNITNIQKIKLETFSTEPQIYADADTNTGIFFAGPDVIKITSGETHTITQTSIGTGIDGVCELGTNFYVNGTSHFDGNMMIMGNVTAVNICYSNGTGCGGVSTYNVTYHTWAYNQTYTAGTYNVTYHSFAYNQTYNDTIINNKLNGVNTTSNIMGLNFYNKTEIDKLIPATLTYYFWNVTDPINSTYKVFNTTLRTQVANETISGITDGQVIVYRVNRNTNLTGLSNGYVHLHNTITKTGGTSSIRVHGHLEILHLNGSIDRIATTESSNELVVGELSKVELDGYVQAQTLAITDIILWHLDAEVGLGSAPTIVITSGNGYGSGVDLPVSSSNIVVYDTNALRKDGSTPLTDNWNAGLFNITADWFLGKVNISNVMNFIFNYNQTYTAGTYNSTYHTNFLNYEGNKTLFYNHTSAIEFLYSKWFYNMSSAIETLYGKWFYNQTYTAGTYNVTYHSIANDYLANYGKWDDTTNSWNGNHSAYSKFWYNQTYTAGTYNVTYDTWAYNQTLGALNYVSTIYYNKSISDANYSQIKWGYNQTTNWTNIIGKPAWINDVVNGTISYSSGPSYSESNMNLASGGNCGGGRVVGGINFTVARNINLQAVGVTTGVTSGTVILQNAARTTNLTTATINPNKTAVFSTPYQLVTGQSYNLMVSNEGNVCYALGSAGSPQVFKNMTVTGCWRVLSDSYEGTCPNSLSNFVNVTLGDTPTTRINNTLDFGNVTLLANGFSVHSEIYEGDAVSLIDNMRIDPKGSNENGFSKIDHSTIGGALQYINGQQTQSLDKTVAILIKANQQLSLKNKQLEATNIEYETRFKELCDLGIQGKWCVEPIVEPLKAPICYPLNGTGC